MACGLRLRALGVGLWASGFRLGVSACTVLLLFVSCAADAPPSVSAPMVDIADKHQGVAYEHAWDGGPGSRATARRLRQILSRSCARSARRGFR